MHEPSRLQFSLHIVGLFCSRLVEVTRQTATSSACFTHDVLPVTGFEDIRKVTLILDALGPEEMPHF